MNRKLVVALLTLLSSVSSVVLATNCSLREDNARDLHLVIDAGSSGTRFCLYRMQFTTASTNSCTVRSGNCQSIPANHGLADLPPDQARAVLQRGFQTLTVEQKRRILHVSLLGTGGFRKLSKSAQQARLQALAQFIFETGYPATVRILSGEEEALLAWRSLRPAGRADYAIVETGGASVQVVTEDIEKRRQALSFPVGMNETRKRLPAKTACFAPPSAERFRRCRTELRPLLVSLQRVRVTETNAYGLGTPYRAIFHQLQGDDLQRSDIDEAGERLCADTAEELYRRIEPEHRSKACYLYAYHSVQMELLGLAQIKRATGSWPQGAAVSPDYFPACR